MPLMIISNDDSLVNNSDVFVLENTKFKNIILFTNSHCDLISINFIANSIFITNVEFMEISSFSNLLIIEKVDNVLLFTNISFFKNEVYNFLFHIKNTLNATFQSIKSAFNNNLNGNYYNQGGGSFRIYNTIYLNLINLQILYAFSVKTAFGIIIIDDFNINTPYTPNPIVLKYKNYLKFI